MRFLLEKSLISTEQNIKFDNMTSNNKLNFISKFIKELPNYRYLDTAEDILTQSILLHGFNTSENKFLNYASKVKWDLNSSTANIIYTLLENGNIKLNFDWLYNRSLYKGKPENINYKIKALAYASNINLQANADKRVKPELFFDGNKVKSIVDIKRILNSINTYKATKDVEHVTGVDLLRDKYHGEYTQANIIDHILNLFPDPTTRTNMMAILAIPDVINDIKRILAADFTDKVLGDDVDSIDMLNKSLIAKLNEIRSKYNNRLQTLKKPNKTRNGEDILINDVNIKTMDDLIKFAINTADESGMDKFKSKALGDWLSTNDGKKALNKILNGKYQDSIVGSALDNLKLDIVQLSDKALSTPTNVKTDAINVLVDSGLKKTTAQNIVNKVYKDGMTAEELVIASFKGLNK